MVTKNIDSAPENQPDVDIGCSPNKLVWNRPVSIGVVDVDVIGGVSWPALSDSNRFGSKSVVESHGSDYSSPQMSPNANSHTHYAENNIVHAEPKKGKNRGAVRVGGSSRSGPSQNNFNRPIGQMPPLFPVVEVPYNIVPPVAEIESFRPHIGNDHSSPRNASRGGNYVPIPRGDGQYNNNHGGRQDQVHLPPRYVAPMRGYMPPPLPQDTTGPFVTFPQTRMFPGQMGFDIVPPMFYAPPMHPNAYRAMPFLPGLPPMLFPPLNENPIVKQIDYYFSDENLDKDTFLRSQMDEQGLVPVSVIASFRRVQLLTKDISEILKAMKHSFIVEIQGDKLRRRDDWQRWLPTSDASTEKVSQGFMKG